MDLNLACFMYRGEKSLATMNSLANMRRLYGKVWEMNNDNSLPSYLFLDSLVVSGLSNDDRMSVQTKCVSLFTPRLVRYTQTSETSHGDQTQKLKPLPH